MTPAEHEGAIEALAVLIGRYLHRDHPPPAQRAACWASMENGWCSSSVERRR